MPLTALAEDYLKRQTQHLPVAIVRLSIVTPSLREPGRGYFTGFQTLMFVVLSEAFGLMRSMQFDGDVRLDVVPVDVAINAIVAVTLQTALSPRTVTVYNVTDKMQLTTDRVERMIKQIVDRNPLVACVRVPRDFGIKTSKWSLWLRKKYDEQLIFAIYSFILWLCGRRDKKTLYEMYQDMNDARVSLELVATRSLHVRTSNFRSLRKTLSGGDAAIFNMDFAFDENTFLEVFDASVKSFRKEKFKEDVDDRKAWRHRLQLRFVEVGLHLIALSVLLLFVYLAYSTMYKMVCLSQCD